MRLVSREWWKSVLAADSNIVIGSVCQWSYKPNADKKPIGYSLVTAVTPDDLGLIIALRRTVQDIGQAVPGVDDDFGTGRDKTVGNQLHATSAAVTHSGTMALSGSVKSYFDRRFPIFSQK